MVQVPVDAVFFILEVKRDSIIRDTTIALQNADPQDLRRPLKVRFAGEQGVDEGGVAREFFRILSQHLFSPEYGMFTSDPESNYLWFHPASFNDPGDFWVVGALLGLAVYNNLPGLDVNFPLALFKKLKGLPVTVDDMRRVFPSQAASLQAVRAWTAPEGLSAREADELFQNIFCLDFSVSFEVFGEPQTVTLLESGVVNVDQPAPPVTLERREEFVEAYKEWYLTTGVKNYFEPFKEGFTRVCGGSKVFDCLSPMELEAIVCGEKDLDFTHLRKSAKVMETEVPFGTGYIEEFWSIMESFDAEKKRQFLNFVTGSDLAPVGGLEQLNLKIHRNGGEPTDKLPTAHTCFNLLMLPEYYDREKLARKLVSAIENSDGFGLE